MLTNEGALSPEAADAFSLRACRDAMFETVPYNSMSCSMLNYVDGAFNFSLESRWYLTGFLAITANLDGEIHTFNDWQMEVGAYIERSAWIPPNETFVKVVIEREKLQVWRAGSDIITTTSHWAYEFSNERGTLRDYAGNYLLGTGAISSVPGSSNYGRFRR